MFLIVDCRDKTSGVSEGFALIDLRYSEMPLLHSHCVEANSFLMERLWVREIEIELPTLVDVLFYPTKETKALGLSGGGWAVFERLPELSEEVHNARKLMSNVTFFIFNELARLHGMVVFNDGRTVFNLNSIAFPFKVFNRESKAPAPGISITITTTPAARKQH